MTWMDGVFVGLATLFLILCALVLLGCGVERPLGPSPHGPPGGRDGRPPGSGPGSTSAPDPRAVKGGPDVVDRTQPSPRPPVPLPRAPL